MTGGSTGRSISTDTAFGAATTPRCVPRRVVHPHRWRPRRSTRGREAGMTGSCGRTTARLQVGDRNSIHRRATATPAEHRPTSACPEDPRSPARQRVHRVALNGAVTAGTAANQRRPPWFQPGSSQLNSTSTPDQVEPGRPLHPSPQSPPIASLNQSTSHAGVSTGRRATAQPALASDPLHDAVKERRPTSTTVSRNTVGLLSRLTPPATAALRALIRWRTAESPEQDGRRPRHRERSPRILGSSPREPTTQLT